MGLKEVLSKLKLVEVVETAEPTARSAGGDAGRASGQADDREIEALLRDLPPPRPVDESLVRPTGRAAAASGAAAPAEEEAFELPDFPSVYRAAGIGEPPHGFTAFKVLEMLESRELAELPPQAKAAALAGFLKMNPTGPVAIAEIIQDAVRRDQALDRFEQFLEAKLADRGAEVERVNARLQAEIDALAARHRATMEANAKAVAGLAARLSEWSAAKRAEERRLQSAVAPFVDGNPISTESTGGAKPAS